MGWNNFPENWEKDIEMIKILPEDYIPKKLDIGRKYHTSWQSNPRFSWTLISFSDISCRLKNKFNGKEFDCKISELRETNQNALFNARKRIKNYNK